MGNLVHIDQAWYTKLRKLKSEYWCRLSLWERQFVQGVESFIEHETISDYQIKKIREIWQERVMKR